MSTVTNMEKFEVVNMLMNAADEKIRLEEFDAKYEDVFCINHSNGIHIYRLETFKEMAKILGMEIVIDPYDEESQKSCFPKMGYAKFFFEYAGRKWEVFALYEDEKEVFA